ncbi:MAG: 50S ribosomal protein L25/general stress protein Ctc [Rhodospirillaceae bacterium]|nr:50S ribosomal protein L25/general stress protein Ctc [Rhodospirillaceae bacterium]
MAEAITIAAERRDRAGKGAARATRRAGRVPAVVYGDKQSPLLVSLDDMSVAAMMRDPTYSTRTYALDIDGGKHTVLARDVQLDPVTDTPIHIDFLRIGSDTMLTIDVPCDFINGERSPGLRRGGVLNIVRHEIEMACRADAIPETIVIDLAGVDIGDSIHISQITLPEGVRPTITDRDFTIATIAAPSAVRSEAMDSQASEEPEA